MTAAVAILGTLLIVSMFGTSLVLMYLVAVRPQLDVSFPISVPGWGTRIEENPVVSGADVSRVNDLVLRYMVELAGYPEDKVRDVIDNARWHFVKADPDIGTQHIYDPWNRKDKNGNTIKIAGWNRGRDIHLVYVPEATIRSLAGGHELCHMVQEAVEGRRDYGHDDAKIFGEYEVVNGKRRLITPGVDNLVKANL